MSKTHVAQNARESIFYVNGVEFKGAPMALEALLSHYDISLTSQGVAVAINERVVPRSAWGTCELCSEDVVEIVHAFQGG
jgi:sulfur carrier protein